TPQQVTLPAPKSGGRPLDVRISSETAPDLFPTKETLQPSVRGVIEMFFRVGVAVGTPRRQ
ncbi:MAG: hypothetical protein ACXVIP_03570, partial [Halobacteriota archaeon]